jgi:hypothetical protein
LAEICSTWSDGAALHIKNSVLVSSCCTVKFFFDLVTQVVGMLVGGLLAVTFL